MYERTYHNSVLKQDSTAPKRRTRFPWKLIGSVLGVILLIWGLVTVIRMKSVQITTIIVEGSLMTDAEDVRQYVRTQLQGTLWHVLPRNSIFVVSPPVLEKDLIATFSRFEKVSVKRVNTHTIAVRAQEYSGVYLWCESSSSCYYMDKKGIVFSKAPHFSGTAYTQLFIGKKQPLPFQPITEEELTMVNTIIDGMHALSMTPSLFRFISDHRLEIMFSHETHEAMIIIDPSRDSMESLATLRTGMKADAFLQQYKNKAKALEYIDLRFDHKMVYKFNTNE